MVLHGDLHPRHIRSFPTTARHLKLQDQFDFLALFTATVSHAFGSHGHEMARDDDRNLGNQVCMVVVVAVAVVALVPVAAVTVAVVAHW